MEFKIVSSFIVIVLIIAVFLIIGNSYIIPSVDSSTIFISSSFDGKEYEVVNRKGKEQSAYILSMLRDTLNSLVGTLKTDQDYLEDNFSNHGVSRIKSLYFSPNDIKEGSNTYTQNKSQIKFCLRTPTGEMSSMNTLVFVAIHELSHVISIQADPNHETEEFHDNFENLLRYAYLNGLWEYIDYSSSPVFHCGIGVNSTPNIL